MRMIIIVVVIAAVGYAGWRYYNERLDVPPPEPVVDLTIDDENEGVTAADEVSATIPPIEEAPTVETATEVNETIPPIEEEETVETATEVNETIPPIEENSEEPDEASEDDPQ